MGRGSVRCVLALLLVAGEGGHPPGPLGRLSLRERFDWLVAPRSTSIQTSPVHTGRCVDLDLAAEKLLQRMVRLPA